MSFVLVVLFFGYGFCVLTLCSGLNAPADWLTGGLCALLGLWALYRMLSRRCEVFDDGSWRIRGFWGTLRVPREAVECVTLVSYSALAKGFEGHRVYVTAPDEKANSRALCISSYLRRGDALKAASWLAEKLPGRRGHDDAYLPPKEAARGWQLALLKLGHLSGA